MRGGPGLGSIGPSQADYFQATKGHGHGDYRVPVLAPSSIAEAVELVADAFELAERYRTPVMILADGVIGQAMEPVVPDLPDAAARHRAAGSCPAPTAGRRASSARSTCGPRTSRRTTVALQAKYAAITEREVRWAGEDLDDAEIVIVAYGTAARVARTAIERAREQGLRVGTLPADHASGRSRRRALAAIGRRGSGRSSSSSCRPARWSRTSASPSRAGRRSSSTAGPAAWSRRPARSSTRSGRAWATTEPDRDRAGPIEAAAARRAGPAEPDRGGRLGGRGWPRPSADFDEELDPIQPV